LQNIRIFFV